MYKILDELKQKYDEKKVMFDDSLNRRKTFLEKGRSFEALTREERREYANTLNLSHELCGEIRALGYSFSLIIEQLNIPKKQIITVKNEIGATAILEDNIVIESELNDFVTGIKYSYGEIIDLIGEKEYHMAVSKSSLTIKEYKIGSLN